MEHITFKGTARFPSTRAISEAIEGVGGSFNAATDRESTVYWVRVPRREATRAMDVLGELIVRPTLDDDEIDGERAVIVEEIRSYLDDPAEYAQILFQQAMFGDGPLGREICGDEAGIRALPAETIRDFWRTTYRPANTVIAVAGDLGHDEAVALAADGVRHAATASSRASRRRRRCPPASGSSFGARRDASQAQLVVGVPGIRRDHPDAWILSVLNAVLGDGMSSRLFLSVREELGLAYDVSSGLVDYADAGALEVSAGVDPERLPAALDAILARARPAARRARPGEELAKAKAYLSGGLELRMDETRHLASWIGGQEALHDRVLTLEEALAEVAAVGVGRRPAGRRRALHRRGAAARGRRAREAPPGARAPAAAAGVTATVRGRRPRPTPTSAAPSSSSLASISGSARWGSPGPSSRRWPAATASTTRGSATLPRSAGGPATCPGPARRPRRISRRSRTTRSAS